MSRKTRVNLWKAEVQLYLINGEYNQPKTTLKSHFCEHHERVQSLRESIRELREV